MSSLLLKKVSKFSSYLKVYEIAVGVLFWLLAVMSVWFAVFMVDNFLVLPAGLRLPITIAGVLFMSALFFKKILRPIKQKRSDERTAMALEEKYGITDNMLINSCQFSKMEIGGAGKGFVDMTIRSSEKMISKMKFLEKKELKQLFKWSVGVLVLLLIWAIYVTCYPQYATNALQRFVKPMEDVPPASPVTLKITPADNVTVLEGDSLEVTLKAISSDANLKDVSPVLVWKEGVGDISPFKSSGKQLKMAKLDTKATYASTFSAIKGPFSFRVFGGGTYSKSVQVSVVPLPKIKKALFSITSPKYTGGETISLPGPPSSLNCLAKSIVKVDIELDNPVKSLSWKVGKSKAEFSGKETTWTLSGVVSTPGRYEVSTIETSSQKQVNLAEADIAITKDNPPEVDFVTEDRNRLVTPGTELNLDIQANDDFGIESILISSRTVEQDLKEAFMLKKWSYLGPPGKKGPVNEKLKLLLDPLKFIPGNTYLIQAVSRDFCITSENGISRPIVLRIKSIDEVNVDAGDPLSKAVDLLKRLIEQQRKTNGISHNIQIHINDIIKKKSIAVHAISLSKEQSHAKNIGRNSIRELNRTHVGKQYIGKLSTLIEGEMSLVMADIYDLKAASGINANISAIVKRQDYILRELILLLGEIAGNSNEESTETKKEDQVTIEEDNDGMTENMTESMKESLEDYVKEQKKILDISKQLRDKDPEDLTDKEEEILGKLAREESKWAKLFEEKLTDWSKLPDQDFSDGSVADEFNEVFQEVKLAAKELYEKKVELAVPDEQAGVESAEELVHNLEKWLSDIPDNKKWSMEDPETPLDIPLAELPDELEDIVGELLDSEKEMTEEVEDVTSQWMDSLDKGAGWEASDGPISNMSAKGITGNMLPNQNEVGGRSGEGRTGRSNGQIVEATAEGKGGRQTPTRLTPSPFEKGSVEDTSTEATGGATGGGKLSGFTEEGLRGPAPPEMEQHMNRLAGNQAKIRQQAEKLALKLTAHNVSTGDIESAIVEMENFEDAAKKGDGVAVRRIYSRILDHLKEADTSVREHGSVKSERNRLPKKVRDDIMKGLREGIPKGYEGIIGEYFKALADEENGE